MGVGPGGLWLAFIGWFLLMAAQASEEQLTSPASCATSASAI
jgi:hypothetical protein